MQAKDSTLHSQAVTVVRYNANQAIVRGLETGTKVLAEPSREYYEGMRVKLE
ncbi:MAG: hypothetical protein HC880_12740 [Bacteroidia bacterium]|nr:hypothetical protein [Bacteroidia bacterium]